MQCQALTISGNQCSRKALPNGRFCGQHQKIYERKEEETRDIQINQNIQKLINNNTTNLKKVNNPDNKLSNSFDKNSQNLESSESSESSESELIPELENLMSEYLDIDSYKKLMSQNQKVYTQEKFAKLRDGWEKMISDEINIRFLSLFREIEKKFYNEIRGKIFSREERTNLVNKYMIMYDKLRDESLSEILAGLDKLEIFETKKVKIETEESILEGYYKESRYISIYKSYQSTNTDELLKEYVENKRVVLKVYHFLSGGIEILIGNNWKEIKDSNFDTPLWKLYSQIGNSYRNLSYLRNFLR